MRGQLTARLCLDQKLHWQKLFYSTLVDPSVPLVRKEVERAEQAADAAELLWNPKAGFVQLSALHDWLEWGLCEADQTELLLQLVQFGRLLHSLARLINASLPPRIEQTLAKYVARELGSCLLLRPGCVAPLLRRSPSGATAR